MSTKIIKSKFLFYKVVILMAKKTKLDFFFEIDSEFKKLTEKVIVDEQLKFYGAILSRKTQIPEEYILVKPSLKAKPIGLLIELESTIADLVEEYGRSYNLYNLLTKPIELYFTTKSIHKNRWNSVTQNVPREKIFADLLPELEEWSGYSIDEMQFITFEDENPKELLKEDYTLTIPELVEKYGLDFEVISLSWTGW